MTPSENRQKEVMNPTENRPKKVRTPYEIREKNQVYQVNFGQKSLDPVTKLVEKVMTPS